MNDGHQSAELIDLIGHFGRLGYTQHMINLLLLTLSLANPKPALTAQFRPCVWPNLCKVAPAPVVAQFTTCVWPKRCGRPAASLITL